MELTDVTSLGSFFALRTTAPPPTAVPLARLYAGDTGPLRRRIDLVAAGTGAGERRVAASVAQLGLASRLWSPALGAAALLGAVPRLDPARLHWDPRAATGDDLWLPGAHALPGPAGGPRRTAGLAGQLHEEVYRTHLEPLAGVLRAEVPVSAGLLRGNAASALAGAQRQLAHTPGADRARELVAALLAMPGLRNTGSLTGTGFRRCSCCLYYRVPGGGVCGDCVFPRPPAARGARPDG
ncbi:(2Fe-2S)-binding protein [Streptomyces sodiiphilus]|uniref:(2Fe-2S)-binding protein n=1 Tax=Streptomyces sodiiphilus TaxID=226217 RepID=A0ABP5A6N5_9ACTN